MTPGTILVVEDEDQVRTLIVRLLEKRGYTVRQAGNGRIALEMVDGDLDGISLVITDMVMPEMGGAALLAELRKLRPDLRALCMTGYTREEVAATAQIDEHSLIEKPFMPAAFLERVAELMQ